MYNEGLQLFNFTVFKCTWQSTERASHIGVLGVQWTEACSIQCHSTQMASRLTARVWYGGQVEIDSPVTQGSSAAQPLSTCTLISSASPPVFVSACQPQAPWSCDGSRLWAIEIHWEVSPPAFIISTWITRAARLEPCYSRWGHGIITQTWREMFTSWDVFF